MVLYSESVILWLVNFANVKIVWKGVAEMKLMNYDTKYLIMQNVRSITKDVPSTYTSC